MKFKAVKGTRDFYPDRMAMRNWLAETWRAVSLRNGFVEFDGPVLEYLDLFSVKSGDEIASQLFSFTDRGGRALAMRPEITPTLARMVNAQINSLPRPIKWFSLPRLFRAENPQKGRLREFFQWNIDIIGSDDVLADAECIFTAIDCLREMGLTAEDVVVRIGSRPLTMVKLREIGVGEDRAEKVLPVLDKRPKVSKERFYQLCDEVELSSEDTDAICRFQDCEDIHELNKEISLDNPEAQSALKDMEELLDYLDKMGVEKYCKLDLRIVRGLAYYTGIVYEIFDAANSLRAVAGGGRYDNLLKLFGGPELGATGFGMGDAVLKILLKEKGKLPDVPAKLDCFVINGEPDSTKSVLGGPEALSSVLEAVGRLRQGGIATDFSAKRQAVGKQLKEANRRNARYAAILRADTVGVKNLATGEQTDVPIGEFLENPKAYILKGCSQ
ncbi:MAG: histidine--tRNA ligase [Phycisphaerae bacterium]|nr:histidine--tRNA ligase [Phycisphaerae bacterium]